MGRNRRTDSLEKPKWEKKEDTFSGRFCTESDPKLHQLLQDKTLLSVVERKMCGYIIWKTCRNVKCQTLDKRIERKKS